MHGGFAPLREGAVMRRARHNRDSKRSERGEVTLEEAAAALKVSEATVRRPIAEKVLPATSCKGAPWVIRANDLNNEDVKRVAEARRQRRPAPANQGQNVLAL
jgi:excisionase family DNA binding protein